jgi:hypothetical protein
LAKCNRVEQLWGWGVAKLSQSGKRPNLSYFQDDNKYEAPSSPEGASLDGTRKKQVVGVVQPGISAKPATRATSAKL